MKHYSPATADLVDSPRLGALLTDEELAAELHDRACRRSLNAELLTEAEIAAEVALRLDGRNGDHGRLAADLGVAQGTLSSVLSGRFGIGEAVARKLGYRRVVRFERTSPALTGPSTPTRPVR